MGLFSKTPTLKDNQRSMQRSIRNMEREKSKLESQQRKIEADMRKMAKLSQISSVKIMAKDLVRTRSSIERLYVMVAQMKALSLRLASMQSSNDMAQTIAAASKIIGACNRRLNVPGMQEVMMEFERNNEMMSFKSDFMNESMEETLVEDDEEQQTETVVNEVLAAVGLEVTQSMNGLTLQPTKTSTSMSDPAQMSLEERLAKLNK